MHLPPKERLLLVGAVVGVILVGPAVGKVLRPVAPLNVEPLAGKAPAIARTAANEGAESPVDAAPSKELVVAVAGAVKKPGLLHLKLDARVDDAIKAAGGAKMNADLEAINLAAKPVDGDQIYVPYREAAKPTPVGGIAPAPQASRVPKRYRGGHVAATYAIRPIQPLPGNLPPAGIEVEPSAIEPETSPSFADEPQKSPRRTTKKVASAPVSLNTASEAQLQTLPGVGPATAKKILEYRASHGGFGSIEEIQSVRGIGPKKFEKMRPYLRL